MTDNPANPTSSQKKPGKRRPDLDTVYSINSDGSRNFLHPADVKGRWQVRVDVLWTLLLVVYAGLPWIQLNGRPAVHLDLPGRKAYLFSLSFTNQDFYLTFFVITAIGFALFVATALFGRVWCGFACPQTVFMEGVFRRVERWIEGPRFTRVRRNLGPMTFDKFWRKALKLSIFLFLSYAIAHVFLAYFLPARELLSAIRSSPSEHPSAFGWTMFWTAVLFFDYAWFREQTCLIICPYGRLQSALIDDDSLIIGYDEKRGEPRSKGVDQGGDCVDCFRCVEVCPTGIDIRNGLQMECINCTRCIDACDDVMQRIEKPEGLVRFDSMRSFNGEKRRSLLRPRVFVYICMGLVGLSVFAWAASGRENFEATVLRARGMPYELEGERIRNLGTLHIQNKTESSAVYRVEGDGGEHDVEFLIAQPVVRLGAMEDAKLPVYTYVARATYGGTFPLSLAVTDSATGEFRRVDFTFRGP